MTTHPTDTPLGTPRTDAISASLNGNLLDFARTLETELNEANRELSDIDTAVTENGGIDLVCGNIGHIAAAVRVYRGRISELEGLLKAVQFQRDSADATNTNLRALLRQKDEALQEAKGCLCSFAYLQNKPNRELAQSVIDQVSAALTPKSPTP